MSILPMPDDALVTWALEVPSAHLAAGTFHACICLSHELLTCQLDDHFAGLLDVLKALHPFVGCRKKHLKRWRT